MIAVALLVAMIDLGGPLGARMAAPPRQVEGVCYSACVLDAIRPGSCIKPGTVLGVHKASDATGTRMYREFIEMDAPVLYRWLVKRHAFDSEHLTLVPYQFAVSLGVQACD